MGAWPGEHSTRTHVVRNLHVGGGGKIAVDIIYKYRGPSVKEASLNNKVL